MNLQYFIYFLYIYMFTCFDHNTHTFMFVFTTCFMHIELSIDTFANSPAIIIYVFAA